MSYILEALKKAEAERLSGVAHASTLPPGFAGAERSGAAPATRRLLWLVAALAAVLAGAATWIVMRDHVPQAPAVSATVPLPPTAAIPADAPVAAAPPSAEPPAAPAKQMPAKEKPLKDTPVSEKTTKKKTEKKPQPPDDTAPLVRAPKETATEAPVATLHDLPVQVRNEIPPLQIGGYIYSANRANRSVLIDKRLLREGDEIMPGLRLEEMARDSMILSYKGYRYRASY